jgi:hypothetical protein
MMSFDLSKWSVARSGLSQLAIAVMLVSAACSSDSGDDDGSLGGTGGALAPIGSGGMLAAATGGKGGTGVVGTGGKPGGTGGVAPGIAGAGGGGAGGAVGGGGSGGAVAMGDGGVTMHDPSCLDGITDYESDGPFTFKTMSEGSVNFWVPDVPAGCKVPVIHLANGTGASCASYGPALERMASHGFLTCCYESPQTGAGDQGVMAFDAALTKFPDLAAHAFGSTGHSQGGQAAFTVLALAEEKWGLTDFIYAGLAMEPASGFGDQPVGISWGDLYAKIKSPMFMFSAVGTDGLVSQSWVMDAFNAMDPGTETYFWTKNGATHIPVPNGEEQEISIPWFRWKLLGDNEACKFFKAIPTGGIADWAEAASNNPAPCL